MGGKIIKIIDIHAHLELNLPGVPQDPSRRKYPRLFMYLFEKLGFRGNRRKRPLPEAVRILISLENQLRLSMASRENLLGNMDRNGIDVSVLLPIAPFSTSEDYLEKVKDEPRMLTFASAHPLQGDWAGRLHAAMENGCRGLKIHPILQELEPSSEFYFNLLEEYGKYGRPVLTHSGPFNYYIPRSPYSLYGSVSRFVPLISSFPHIPFILGHMGIHESGDAIQVASQYENVYLETSFQSLRSVREAVKTVGKERVLFGSDWPEADQGTSLKIARKAAGSDRDLMERILGKNAESLIGPL